MRVSRASSRAGRRPGLGAVELIVVVVIVSFLAFCVLIALPKGRETSRMAGCQRNLMQVGVATLLYQQANRHYPATSPLRIAATGPSPVQTMLEALTLPDFLDVRDPSSPPPPTAAPGLGARVPGLVCPSDSVSDVAQLGTAISYRGNVGDTIDGANGPFSPGGSITAERVEAADGLAYTAGFTERLLGAGLDGICSPRSYAVVVAPVDRLFDPATVPGPRWRGGAGSSWADPTWRSAVYTHAAPLNAGFSCIAEDGRTAMMGASSAHPGRINVWMLDGSLRGVAPTIDPAVWRALGSIGAIAQNTARTSSMSVRALRLGLDDLVEPDQPDCHHVADPASMLGVAGDDQLRGPGLAVAGGGQEVALPLRVHRDRRGGDGRLVAVGPADEDHRIGQFAEAGHPLDGFGPGAEDRRQRNS